MAALAVSLRLGGGFQAGGFPTGEEFSPSERKKTKRVNFQQGRYFPLRLVTGGWWHLVGRYLLAFGRLEISWSKSVLRRKRIGPSS